MGVYRRGAALAAAVATAGVAVVFLAPVSPAAGAPAGIECGAARSDVLDHEPWPLRWLQPQLAWPLSRGQDVVVAVVDSGISGTHPELTGQLLPNGTNLVPPSPIAPQLDPNCDNTHGTLVASIIAGRDTRDSPFHGIAPDAKILPVRVVPNADKDTGPDVRKRIADGIRYAVNQHADVINLSLHTDPTPDLAQAIQYALSHNVVVVAAAGNVGAVSDGQPVYPAAYDGVIAVAGITQNGKHADSSISGNYVALAAPGVQIEGPAPRGNGYGLDPQGGTSFAAAYVSGVAALLRAYLPAGTPVAQIRRRLELTADAPPDGWDPQVGYGVVNPARALGAILDTRTSARLAAPGQVPPPSAPADPLAVAKQVAAWGAPAGVLLAVLVLLIRPVLRRGRARSWRPG